MNSYKFIIIPFLGLVISQIIKFILESIKYKRLCLERILDGSGGMPSSHSSFVTSLTTTIALNYGFTSVYFAISLIFSLVVIYDSMGVRYEAGKQAEILNDIVEKIQFNKKIKELKEKVGHKPIEVLCGVMLGLSIALIFNEII